MNTYDPNLPHNRAAAAAFVRTADAAILHEIRTVADLLAIPTDKIADCLIDLRRWHDHYTGAKPFPIPSGLVDTSPRDVFRWLDDGRHDVHVSIVMSSKPDPAQPAAPDLDEGNSIIADIADAVRKRDWMTTEDATDDFCAYAKAGGKVTRGMVCVLSVIRDGLPRYTENPRDHLDACIAMQNHD